MPIIKSAKKALRGSKKKRVFNTRRKEALKDAVRDVKKLVADLPAQAGKKAKEAKDLLAKAYQAIDKAAKKGVIKKNTASRKKSRLSALVKKAQ